MKEIPDMDTYASDRHIDELLNSFIDGELTARQHTEVQRLITHNAQIARRLGELQKCKILVGSLPGDKASAEMAEEIKTSLEARELPKREAMRFGLPGAPLGQQPPGFERRRGARHLLVRKVIAAAAMIGLVAILTTLVYTIVAPESITDEPIVSKQPQQPTRKIQLEKPSPSLMATAEESIAQASPGVSEFVGRLELKTSALTAVDAFINKAIGDSGPLDRIGPRSQQRKGVYTLSCSRERLDLLLADLENIWDRFDSAALFVETGQLAGEVVVDAVSAEQIAEIVNQAGLESGIKVAKDFAVLNNIAELLPGKELFAAMDGKGEDLTRQWRVPKPVLTSSEKTIKKPASQAEIGQNIHLTIVVVGSE